MTVNGWLLLVYSVCVLLCGLEIGYRRGRRDSEWAAHMRELMDNIPEFPDLDAPGPPEGARG